MYCLETYGMSISRDEYLGILFIKLSSCVYLLIPFMIFLSSGINACLATQLIQYLTRHRPDVVHFTQVASHWRAQTGTRNLGDGSRIPKFMTLVHRICP